MAGPQRLPPAPPPLHPHETFDLLWGNRVGLVQARAGYRTSVDSLALAWFGVSLARQIGLAVGDLADLGAGSGLVAIAAALAEPGSRAHLYELQPQLADRARRNLEHNGLAGRSTVHLVDLARPPPPAPADLVLCNPPFRQYPDQPPPDPERRVAHFDAGMALPALVTALLAAVDRRGVGCIIYPWKHRQRLEQVLQSSGVAVQFWPLLHRPSDPEPVRVLAAVRRGPLPPVVPLSLHCDGQPDSQFARPIAAFIESLHAGP
ncbi:MAG: methyltransferase [Deltaproteobacteria bacterium]|nr:methyltransferase [Deltaproteobacteria bacterium]